MPKCRSSFNEQLVYDTSIASYTIHINDVARARRGALAGSLHIESTNTDVAIVPVELSLTIKTYLRSMSWHAGGKISSQRATAGARYGPWECAKSDISFNSCQEEEANACRISKL